MTEPPPSLLVIAGPNGSGKSTLTNRIAAAGYDLGLYINADDIAATLVGSYDERVKSAQRQAERERELCLAGRQSFSFETVMSHRSKLDVMSRAREKGYEVTLFFVAIADPRINIERVAARVRRGGHDVDEDRIVQRWHRTMGFLADATTIADRSVVFDNTDLPDIDRLSAEIGIRLPERSALRPVAQVVNTEGQLALTLVASAPDWVKRYLFEPLQAMQQEGRLDLSTRFQDID
jgi:predicted ABC-type ATPase